MSVAWLLFGFRGRIGRLAYWLGGLAQLFGWYVLVVSVIAFVEATDAGMIVHGPGGLTIVLVIGSLFAVVLVVVNFALCAKRFHDRDHSLWRFLIVLVPIAGPTWLLIELGCLPGTSSTNRYGPVPEPLFRHSSGDDRGWHGQRTAPDPYVPSASSSEVVERLTGPARTVPSRLQFGRRRLGGR